MGNDVKSRDGATEGKRRKRSAPKRRARKIAARRGTSGARRKTTSSTPRRGKKVKRPSADIGTPVRSTPRGEEAAGHPWVATAAATAGADETPVTSGGIDALVHQAPVPDAAAAADESGTGDQTPSGGRTRRAPGAASRGKRTTSRSKRRSGPGAKQLRSGGPRSSGEQAAESGAVVPVEGPLEVVDGGATAEAAVVEEHSAGSSNDAPDGRQAPATQRRTRRGRRGGVKHRRKREAASRAAAAKETGVGIEQPAPRDDEDGPSVRTGESPRGADRAPSDERKHQARVPRLIPDGEPSAVDRSTESDERGAAGGRSTASTRPRSRSRGRKKVVKARSVRGAGKAARTTKAKKTSTRCVTASTISTRGTREMIIEASDDHECRIAILHNDRLEELFMERQSSESCVGNISSGRIVNTEPGIQAAFVDFGHHKHGFLHISDVQPAYFGGKEPSEPEQVGRKIPRGRRPPIQQCFRRGDELIVQVIKDGVGTKGPTLTTYLSIPGRLLVMMPGMQRLGVSRKIEDADERRDMRDVLKQLDLPKGLGFILRTAGLGQNKRELQRDLNYLNRLWKTVNERARNTRPPTELYRESDLVTRTLRDVYTSDFKRIVVDHQPTAQRVREFLRIAMPRTSANIEEYTDRVPIFRKFGIEEEIKQLHSRRVPLSSGGSLVIESTEAMVTIDVNSGKFRESLDAEETAYRTDLEAADEIARQLRLRDLGGLVVCDFIDLRAESNKRAVEKRLRDALRAHKERAHILRMSEFGLIEMTRQRRGPPILRDHYAECSQCRGSGVVKTAESAMLDVMRLLRMVAHREDVHSIAVAVSPGVAHEVLNRRRATLHALEHETGKTITIRTDSAAGLDEITWECRDRRGRRVGVEY